MPSSEDYRISSLEIENFRQYRNAHIKFSRDPQKAFTIIRGSNGAGKTNIMNAITWCLYGTEKHIGSSEKDFPTINSKALKEKPDGIVNMQVRIKLADSKGDKFMIQRHLSLLNNGELNTVTDKGTGILIPKDSTPSISTMFQWYDSDKGGWKNTEYFDKEIKDLLPEDLATYFLFDGEKLEDFFEQTDNTKKGIEDVSQIKITEQAIKTLNKFISQKMKNAKNLNPQTQKYRSQVNEKKKELVDIKKKIKKINTDLQTKERRVTEIEKTIVKAGGDTGKDQIKANNIKNEIEQIQKQHDDTELKRQNHILEHMSGIQLLSSIEKTVEHIKTRSNDGELPPKIKETFLKEMLDGGQCMCGNDISVGQTARQKITQLLGKAQYSEISEMCTELKYELKPILEIDDIKAELVELEKDMLKHAKLIKKKQDDLDELNARIGNVDNEQIRKISSEKTILNEGIKGLEQELGWDRKTEDEAKKKLDSYQKDLLSEMSKDSKQKHLTHQLKFCQDALSTLSRVKTELLDDMRDTVQRHTKKYFLKFLWKKDTYDDVIIDENYQITAHHVDGYNVRTGLSKGEKLVLALSFMAALRKITGFGFPLLIDTPLGRVSGEPRYNIASELPVFLKNNQVTLLVTDSEYQAEIQDDDNNQVFPPIRDTIEKYVGADYDIKFAVGESKVVKR